MQASTLSSKYQVVIPRSVRERYGLAPGQRLQFVCLPDRIELIPLRAPAELRGFLPGENDFRREADRL